MKLYRNPLILTILAMSILFLSTILILNDNNTITNDNFITGNGIVNTKVEVFPTIFKNCSFHLYPGWNMVSFYCLGMFAERSIVLHTIENSYGAIFEYQTFDVADPWKSYNPNLPNWTVQQLNYMDRISGYWIYMSNDADFSYSGVYSDSIILLYDGWNFVGYPNTLTTNITTTLNGIPFSVAKNYINTNITISNCITNFTTNFTTNITINFTVCDVTTITDTWLTHVNGAPNNTLNEFNPYKGYWLNVTGGARWNITR
jgi:hypothetical protein